MSKRQIAAMIARRKAAQKIKSEAPNLLAACLDAAGFAEHHAY
jgi:hypothetical protein